MALKTPRTLQLEIHEQQLANGCFGSERPRGTIGLARAVGSHELGSTAAPRGWTGAFGTNGPGAFLESGKDVTCALSPSRIQASNAANSDLRLYFPGLFVPPSSWPAAGGFASIKWTWRAQLGTAQIDNDANCPALGWCLHECSCKHYKSLHDESRLTPLLTPLKEDCAICNPKTTLFLIQGRLLVLIFFSWWMVDL